MRSVDARKRLGVTVILLVALALALRLGAWEAARGEVPPRLSSRVPGARALGPVATPNADGVVQLRSALPPAPPVRGVSVLTLQFSALRPLAAGHYEGWAIFADERISTGKFAVNAEGVVTALNGAAISAFPLTRDIVTAERLAITIEPEGDRDAAPSGVTILEGAFVNARAELSTIDLQDLAGGFTLMTPTDADTSNDASGLWFYDRTTRQSALRLPDLPSGWVYEGWVGSQGLTFSTGRFTGAVGPDRAAPFSGPRAGLAVPGEDLVARLPATVRAPVNLRDGASTVAISIEPDRSGQDPTGPAPFWLLVLRLEIPRAAPTATLLPLDVDLSVVPSGVATVG